jgi:hypothetical protein
MDKKTALGMQQDKRRWKLDDRKDHENIDDRLADGFDLLSEDDPKDPLPPQVTDLGDQEE